MSFKELVYFISVINFAGLELFIIFLYYSFNIYEICSDVPSITYDINNFSLSSYTVCESHSLIMATQHLT